MLASSDPVGCFSRVASFNSACPVSPPLDACPPRPSSLPACPSLAPSSSCSVVSVASRAPATSAPCSPAAVPGPSGRGSAAFEPSPANASRFPSSSSRDIVLAGSDGATVVSGTSSCPSSSRLGGRSLRLPSRLACASPGSSSSCRGAAASSRTSGSASARAGSTAGRSFLSFAAELERRPRSVAVKGLVRDAAPRLGARRNTPTKRPIKRTGTARSGPPSRFRKLRKDIVEPEENHARDPRLGRDFRGQMIRVTAGTIVAYQVARSISGPETAASDNGTLSLRGCGGALHTDSTPGAGRSVIGSGPMERCDTGASAPRRLPLRITERSYRMMPGARSAHRTTSSAPGAGRSVIGSGPTERCDAGPSRSRRLPLRITERSYRMMPGARSAHPATSDKRCYVKKWTWWKCATPRGQFPASRNAWTSRWNTNSGSTSPFGASKL